jgi:hypothetical protein
MRQSSIVNSRLVPFSRVCAPSQSPSWCTPRCWALCKTPSAFCRSW